MIKKIIILSSLLISMTAFAGGTVMPTTNANPWAGSNAQFGGLVNTGNTQSKNINGEFTADYHHNNWVNATVISAQLATSQNVKTAEQYSISNEYNYFFSKHNFLFARVGAVQDKFSSYDYVISESVGYGRRVYDKHDMTLDLQAGPGGRHSKLTNTGPGQSKYLNEFIVYTAANYNWQISPTTSFQENLSAEIGQPNVMTKSVTAITSKIVGNLALQFSFTAANNSYIPANSTKTEHLDTVTSINLVYHFA